MLALSLQLLNIVAAATPMSQNAVVPLHIYPYETTILSAPNEELLLKAMHRSLVNEQPAEFYDRANATLAVDVRVPAHPHHHHDELQQPDTDELTIGTNFHQWRVAEQGTSEIQTDTSADFESARKTGPHQYAIPWEVLIGATGGDATFNADIGKIEAAKLGVNATDIYHDEGIVNVTAPSLDSVRVWTTNRIVWQRQQWRWCNVTGSNNHIECSDWSDLLPFEIPDSSRKTDVTVAII